jgi:hypothetical protein
LKLLQESIGKTLEDKGIGNYLLNRTQIAQETRTITNKWDCIELKSICISKETITRSYTSIKENHS